MSIVQAVMAVVGSGAPPYYYLAMSGNYNEGGTLYPTLYYDHIRGQTLYWTIVNDSATHGVDFNSSYGTSGSFYVQGAGGYTITTITNVSDNTTEGLEWYYFNLGTYPGGADIANYHININDTSVSPPSPTASFTMAAQINEGSTLTASVTTTNVANGTTMYWWKKSGVANVSDVNAIGGTFTINSNSGSFSITPRADLFTEGDESLNIAIGFTDGVEVYWAGTTIMDTSTLYSVMMPFNTQGVPNPASDGAIWTVVGSGGDNPNGIIHGSWTREPNFTSAGGVTLPGASYIEFPTKVPTDTFTIEMVANFTNVGGWQSIWDTGSMNEGGVGYTCYTAGGIQFQISTNYGTGSAGSSAFTLGSIYEGLAHWVFVVDVSSGDNNKIYRNGVELTKVAATASAPLDYGSYPLMIGARRISASSLTDYAQGTIYYISAASGAYDQNAVNIILNARRTQYGAMTLNGPPDWGYGGNLAIFGTNQYSVNNGNNIVKVGFKVIAVGGTQDGWTATISETNAIQAGGLRVGSDTWPTDATSYILRPF